MKSYFIISLVLVSGYICASEYEHDLVYVHELKQKSMGWEMAKGALVGATLADGSYTLLPDSIRSKLPGGTRFALCALAGAIGAGYQAQQTAWHNFNAYVQSDNRPSFDQELSPRQAALNKLCGKWPAH